VNQPVATDVVHFLQIWIIPRRGIEPEYEQRHRSAADRRGRLRLIARPYGAGDSLHLPAIAMRRRGHAPGCSTGTAASAAGRSLSNSSPAYHGALAWL